MVTYKVDVKGIIFNLYVCNVLLQNFVTFVQQLQNMY